MPWYGSLPSLSSGGGVFVIIDPLDGRMSPSNRKSSSSAWRYPDARGSNKIQIPLVSEYADYSRHTSSGHRRRIGIRLGAHPTAGRARSTSPGHRSTRRTPRSEEHTSELQSRFDLVCRRLL